MMTRTPRHRAAFTLLELLVVLSILVVLAAIAVPKVVDTLTRSQAATQAFSTADVARQIETYYALNQAYPDGWDLLLSSPDALALYGNLSSHLSAGILTTETLTSDQIAALQAAGIGHTFLHDASSAPSDSGTDRRHFGTGVGHDGTANISTFAVIDKTVGGAGLDLLVNGFGLNPNRNPSDTVLPRISVNTYVALGIGPRTTLVQSQLQEAPLFPLSNADEVYSRGIAVFEVPNAGRSKARLVGVIGPDGRSKRDSIADYQSADGGAH